MNEPARSSLFRTFDELGIETSTVEHPPVFTVEEARQHTGHLPGGHCKNLFLKDKKGGFWLIVCLDDQPVKVSHIQKIIGAPRLSFAKPEALDDVLGVQPGAVTPFALINDVERRVTPVLDSKMLEKPVLNYHPLSNDATTAIKPGDLITFVKSMGYEPVILDLDPPAEP